MFCKHIQKINDLIINAQKREIEVLHDIIKEQNKIISILKKPNEVVPTSEENN